MRDYTFVFKPTIIDHDNVLRDIVQKRKEDIEDFSNLNSIFVSGRTVKRIPSDSSDIIVGDREGDISIGDGVASPDYMYILVNNSGSLEWRRAALGVF